MGNSQSLDKVQHVVSEGISIYQQVKKQQEQEQHHQYQQTTTTTHTYSQHTTNSSHYVASPNVDDDQEYTALREKAHEEAEKRNRCYAESQEAYQGGDGARGNEKRKKKKQRSI